MSNDTPRPGEPEYLGDAPAATTAEAPGRSRRGLVGAAAAAGVLGVVAVGGWAAVSLMSSGEQPAVAVPANALGYVSLDLDPSAGQKIEAIKLAKKFPALDEELGMDAQEDLRKRLFEEIEKETDCGLDYDRDVAPWIGDRVAMAAVPTGDKGGVAPLVTLQVTDQEAADEGLAKLFACDEAGDEEAAVSFSGDYALITETQENADAFAKAADESSLADDEDFTTWTEAVGEPGVVTMYAAAGALGEVDWLEMMDPTGGMAMGPEEQAMVDEMTTLSDQMTEMYGDVGAMAAVVRFDDGAAELEYVGESMPEDFAWAMPEGASHAGDLPAGTAVAYSVALGEGWLQGYLDTMESMMGEEFPVDPMMRDFEAQTGIEMPEDLEKLLGDSTSLAVAGDLDIEALEHDPAATAAGFRITGDTAEITGVLDKLRQLMGPDADMLVVEEGDGTVAVGLNEEYVQDLVGAGSLGDEAAFQGAVPHADESGSVVYVDFDAVSRWVEQGMGQDGDLAGDEQKILDNLEPLGALGVSGWVEDDGSSRALMRLTTD
ncbi:MAG TPA: DUF3352 domain-containing protein [Nocardioidaceae bacterium]